jgi:guanylate kinase
VSQIIVFSGPSGSGKTSLTRELCRDSKYQLSISTTTREPRFNEVDGVDYFFVSHETFMKDIEDGLFIEWAKVHNNYYGTSKKFVEDTIRDNKIVVFDIDVQGNKALKSIYPDNTLSIFVTTKSINILKDRLIYRNTDSDDVIEKRLINAIDELKSIKDYDYLIINDEFDKSLNLINSIILSESIRQRVNSIDEFINKWKEV